MFVYLKSMKIKLFCFTKFPIALNDTYTYNVQVPNFQRLHPTMACCLRHRRGIWSSVPSRKEGMAGLRGNLQQTRKEDGMQGPFARGVDAQGKFR